MAPPPSPDLPLFERFMALVKTLQFAWFSGHLTLLLCVTRYLLSWIRMNYYSGMAQFCYRTTFIATSVTYGIVVYKTMRARARAGQTLSNGLVGMLSDENIQYMAMAFIWLIMPQYLFAMLPYAIYSVFHVATYTRSNLIPTLSPNMSAPPAGTPNAKPVPAPNALSERIGWFVKEYYDSAMAVVAALEIAIWVRLLLAAIFFQRRSWILIAFYTAFLRTRFAQSTHVQNSFGQLDARVNTVLGAQNIPPAARQGWTGVKTAARQFHDATDAHKYMGGAAPAAKKSS